MRALFRSLFGAAASPPQTPSADAQKAMVAAILELRAVVKSGTGDQIAAAIDVFKAKATAGDLEPRELAGEVADAERMVTVLAYADRLNRGEGVQAMAVMPDGEPAYFHAPRVRRETGRADDDYGRLDIGDKGIFFAGDKRVTIVWGKVLTIGLDRGLLIVHPAGGGTPKTFGLPHERQAGVAHAVASAIFQQQAATVTPPKQRKRAVRPPVGGEFPIVCKRL